MKDKKIILLGFPNPIRMRNKEYVLKKLYERASNNPFIHGKTFEEYREFLCLQIKDFGDIDVDSTDTDKIYDSLKSMGWIKVISAVVIAVISAHTAIS
jgi:hypothetical protein|tara:strand:- start:2322 stop:2615 length:294 start_codon:yes stop_codon:yes gene_type:complete